MIQENFNELLQRFGCLLRLKWAVTKDHQNYRTMKSAIRRGGQAARDDANDL